MTSPSKGLDLWNADLGEMTEEQIKALFEAGEKKQRNAERIVVQYLVEGRHYGYALEDGDATIAPDKPMLYQAGAELLRERFRYHIQHMRTPIGQHSKHLVGWTVEVGIYTQGGRLLAVSAGHCNSKDGYWKKGRGWKYKDPRDVSPGILTLAQNRAGKVATREALGLTSFFCDPEEHRRVFMDAPIPKGLKRWEDEDRQKAKALVKRLGMKDPEFVRLVCQKLGYPMVGAGADAEIILAELERRVEAKEGKHRAELIKEMAA